MTPDGLTKIPAGARRCILCERLILRPNIPTHGKRCVALKPMRAQMVWLDFQLRRAPGLAVIETMAGTVGIRSPLGTWAHLDGSWGEAPGAVTWPGAVPPGAQVVARILDEMRPWWPEVR